MFGLIGTSLWPEVVAICVVAILFLTPAAATGQIIEAIALHAVEAEVGACDIPDPCLGGTPNTQVSSGSRVVVYVTTSNTPWIDGLQTAFDWEPGRWDLIGSEWTCRENQMVIRAPTGPGPEAGTLTTTFDPAEFGESQVIGMLHVVAHSGCLTQVVSSHEHGTYVSWEGIPYAIEIETCGTVCVGEPGIDACYPAPVEAATWGQIRAQYR